MVCSFLSKTLFIKGCCFSQGKMSNDCSAKNDHISSTCKMFSKSVLNKNTFLSSIRKTFKFDFPELFYRKK